MKKFQDFPLRERKQSKTRIAIHMAAMELMQEHLLKEIKVEDICRVVDISRGTFFSYFTRKADLIVYAIRLWSIGEGWHYSQLPESEKGLAHIRRLFHDLADKAAAHPNVHTEILALRAFHPKVIRRMNEGSLQVISEADRLYYYPDKPGIETIPEGTIVTYFKKNLLVAIEEGELPPGTPVDQTLIGLSGLLYGTLNAALGSDSLQELHGEYDRQLEVLWAGIRSVFS
ncbi:MAG: TetR/AcrR family transcriptional regulator [Desulfobacterales bacterium]|nr:TetR/AcrR family transcriptional regulator [Desulfobacterales bacterium]